MVNAGRMQQALAAADDALATLESGTADAGQCLMKLKPLARLVRDADAQAWLDNETRGYPGDFDFSELRTCEKYVRESGRLTADGKYYPQSLPEIEASVIAAREGIAAFKFPDQFSPSLHSANEMENTGTSMNYVVKNLTENLASKSGANAAALKSWTKVLHGIRGGLHNYAADAHIAISFGDVAESIFDGARLLVDTFVRDHCPRAAEQLLAVNERARESNPESMSAALTSCRRLFVSVADAVFPPRAEPHLGRDGKSRKVGPEEYKNRLLAYVESRAASDSSSVILGAQLQHLASRLDAVHEKTCKGVHANISQDETRLTIIETYLFLAEVARLRSSECPAQEEAS